MAGGGANQQTAARPAPNMGGQPSVYQQAAGQYNAAAAGPNIGQFMNPYTQDVIGRTGMDMMRQGQMQSNQIGAAATQAGAFGGSRHGVAEGAMYGDMGRAFGDMAAQQRQSGFNTALNAAQNQQGIQSQLAGQGFGFGQAIGGQQAQQGAMMQGMNQQLIDAARNQFAGFANAPNQALATRMAGVGAGNFGQGSTTQTKTPGLLDILSLGVGLI